MAVSVAPVLRDSVVAEVRARAIRSFGHVRHNPKLLTGLVLLVAMLALGVLGPFFIDTDEAKPMSVAPDQEPSREFPFGTESQGRDMLALVVRGIPLTIEIGLIAGAIGLGIGTILGFVAGYTGGIVDTIIRSAADIILTVPGLLVLIVVASSIKGLVTVQTIAFVVAS